MRNRTSLGALGLGLALGGLGSLRADEPTAPEPEPAQSATIAPPAKRSAGPQSREAARRLRQLSRRKG